MRSFRLAAGLLAALLLVPVVRAQGELTDRNVAVLVAGSYARALVGGPSGGGLNAYGGAAGLAVGRFGAGVNYGVAEAGEYDRVRAGGGSVSYYLAREGVTSPRSGTLEVAVGLTSSEVGDTFTPALVASRRLVETPEVVVVPQGSAQFLVPLNEKNVSGREFATVLSAALVVGLGAPDSRFLVAPMVSYVLDGAFSVGVTAGLVIGP